MVANMSFNPMATTNAAGSFNVSSEGYIQGIALDDPSARNWLAGGVLALAESLPMWGGVAISESIAPPSAFLSANQNLGTTISRATSVPAAGVPAAGVMTGFSVFNQAHHAISSPQSPIPLILGGMSVHFYRFGSQARIPVNIDPSLVSLEGGLVTQQVSWDFVGQRLVPYEPTQGQIAITSQTWAGGIVTVVTAAAHNLVVGNDVNLSGAAPLAYNGAKTVLTAADNTHFTYAMAANPGTSPAATPGVVAAGGGLLPVRVLDLNIGNSMTVQYDPITGFATWNRSGSTAIILL